MLALSLTFFQVITPTTWLLLSNFYIIHRFLYNSPKAPRPNFNSTNPPIIFHDERDGSLYGCVALYRWYIITCLLGLYSCLHPFRRPRQQTSTTSHRPSKLRKPPDIFL
jgi:hypothetical protein